jgi:hypothetical protein
MTAFAYGRIWRWLTTAAALSMLGPVWLAARGMSQVAGDVG